MALRPRVILVVPCYNEAARLPVPQFASYLDTSTTEIIFVDDGSHDGTYDVLSTIQHTHPDRVSIVRCAQNAGKAEAVRRGINEALTRQPDYVGYWDADLATPLAAIDDYLALCVLQPSCYIVLGARVRLLGRAIVRPAHRHYLGRVFSTMASLVLKLPVYDTQCGAKLFRVTDQTAALFAAPFLSRWVFDVEILARHIQGAGSLRAGAAQIVELPLQQWSEVRGSKVKPQHFVTAVWDLCRIYHYYCTHPAFRRTGQGTL